MITATVSNVHADCVCVALEHHGGPDLWVHRKGAMPAADAQPGVLPGSMGNSNFHVQGSGHPAAFCSSARGAGRAWSRTATRAQVRKMICAVRWTESGTTSFARNGIS